MRLFAQRAVLSCSLLTLPTAAPLIAQECLGYTTRPGQLSLNPGVTFADHATTFGATVNAHWPGPLWFEGGIGITSYDHKLIDSYGWELSGRVGYELRMQGVSICPFTGLAYSRVVDDPTLSGTIVPLGLALGRTFPVGSRYNVTLSGAPQLLHFRQKSEWEGLESESESDVELGLSLAALLGTDWIYGRVSFALGLVGDRYNGVGISMGFPLGR